MGLLDKRQGVLKKRVDFQNPETQKALKNLIEFLTASFDLPPGETYKEIAEDAISAAIQQPFVIMSGQLHEDIYSRALNLCQKWSGDDEEDEELAASQTSESDLEDAYHAIEAIAFTGSQKQIDWAKRIAHREASDIASLWKKKDFSLPVSAKWWIDNREDIAKALNAR